MSEMTACDYAVMNGGGWNNWMNNPFMYLIFLRFLSPDGYGYNAAAQGALTRAELTDGLNNQTMQRDISNVRETVGNVGLMVQDAGAKVSEKLCCGFNSVNQAIAQNRFDLGSGIAENRFATQHGFCETNRNIDAVRYENAKNTCAITTAIHEDGEKTRALMIQQQMQDLRDRNAALNNELQSAQLALAQGEQSRYILGSLGRYMPYAGCGCACNGSNW